MFRKSLPAALLIGAISALAFVPQSATAAGTTASLTVMASITNTCIFDTTSDTINFGGYEPIVTNATAPINKTYTASYTCTAGDSAYTFAFTSPQTTGGLCYMINGGSKLQYTISDAGNSDTTYCTGTAAAAHSEPTTTGSPTLASTYAFSFSLLAGQNTAIAGSYNDVMTVTIATL